MAYPIKDITGKRFGRLVVINKSYRDDKEGGYFWRCQCDCGNEIIVRSISLRKGDTKSCGCLCRELSSLREKTHGLSQHHLMRKWIGIKQRCYNSKNKDYLNYGARGIKVCSEWISNFQAFYDWCISNGWEKGLEIDRRDNDGNYEPDNCRFVTTKKNCRNRRNSRIFVIDKKEYEGSNAAAKALGVSQYTIQAWCGTIGHHGKKPKAKPGCYSYFKYKG